MSTRRADMLSRTRVTSGAHAGVLYWQVYWTPWGEGRIGADEKGLRMVQLPVAEEGGDGTRKAPWGASLVSEGEASSGAEVAFLQPWVAALEDYFQGRRLTWSAAEIPWENLKLSTFTRTVYETLLTVHPGETVSYAELARKAGCPRAARAVGTAMAKNPLPIIIPCHRVIRADGSLGWYGTDPSWKPRLLEHERSALRGGRGGCE